MSVFNRKDPNGEYPDPMNLAETDSADMENETPYEQDSDESGETDGAASFRNTENSGSSGIAFFQNLFSGENILVAVSMILALLLLLASGFLAYRTHALSEENAKLDKRVQRDTKLKQSEEEYQTETENLENETKTLINRYGVGNTPEKTIMFLVNLSSTSGLSVTSVEFGETQSITQDENGTPLEGAADASDTLGGSSDSSDSDKDGEKDSKSRTNDQDDENDADENSGSGEEKDTEGDKAADGQYYLYKYQVTISYTGSYSELKKAINFIEAYGERTTVDSITATYDETTENLTGSMTLNMYLLSGADLEYEPPSVSGSIGTSNIFG